MTKYLQIIKTYSPENFDIYFYKLLNISCKPNSKHITNHQNDLCELILYVINNASTKILSCFSMIVTILLSRQQNLMSKPADQYFSYLIRMKKLVKQTIKKMGANTFTPFDILYEVICKNISLYMSMNSVSNIYKQELDYNKITVLDKFLTGTISDTDINFEMQILNA